MLCSLLRLNFVVGKADMLLVTLFFFSYFVCVLYMGQNSNNLYL